VTTGGGYRMPALSRDASKIVFVSGSGANAEIDTIPVNAASGIAPTTVVASDASHTDFRNPVFSPDGSYIVFVYLSGSSSLLGRVNITGGAIQPISGRPSRSYGSPSFSSSGSLLAASGQSAFSYDSLEQVSLGGGANVIATLPSQLANRAQISPAGDQVALDLFSNGVSKLYAYNLTGVGSFRRLVFYGAVPTNETFPTWVGFSQVGYSSDFGRNDSVYVVASSARDDSGLLKVPSAIEPFYAPY